MKATEHRCVFSACRQPVTHLLCLGDAELQLCSEHADVMNEVTTAAWILRPIRWDQDPAPGPEDEEPLQT